MMVQLSQQGMAVVFSTSDLKEIMAVSDRIPVMSGGKLTADIVRDRAEESALVSASAQGSKMKMTQSVALARAAEPLPVKISCCCY